MEDFLLTFDGACKGNPGHGSSAFILYNKGKIVHKGGQYFEKTTNNRAEYCGVLLGLKYATAIGIKRLSVKGDSMLAINQLNGTWKVKNEDLRKIYEEVRVLVGMFDEISFKHVYRSENKDADAEANDIIRINT